MKYAHLREFLVPLSPIPESEWLHLESVSTLEKCARGDVLLAPGDHADSVGLLISGSVRMYYLDSAGKEYNHAFMFEGNLFAAFPSLLFNSPSSFAIQTMEETLYLKIPYDEVVKLYDRHFSWERLARKALEINYVDKMRREEMLLVDDALERYRKALLIYPELEKRVPQYHIATFCGVTASALNRLLKSK
jgi:CRP-like cAMP-binding protein